MSEALAQRQMAFNLFEDHDRTAAYLEEARTLAADLYERFHAPVTVNDIRKKLPPPDDLDGRIMGAIFRKGWRKVGYAKSDRTVCHGRDVSLFVPKDAKKEDYLEKING